MDVFCVSSLFCLHKTDWVEWVLCLVSMPHPVMLLLFLQYHWLLLWKENGKEWIVDGYLVCVFFLLSSQFRLSSVSVVFDFNDSLNDVVPESPILLPVYEKRKEKSELLMDASDVHSFFGFHHLDRVQWVLCLISMIHSMMLLLFLQWYCLLLWGNGIIVNCLCISFVSVFFLLSSPPRPRSVSVVFDFNASLNGIAPARLILLSVNENNIERVNCWLMSFMCLLSFVFTTQIKFCECCVWLQWFTQWCCSSVSNVVVCWNEEKRKGWIVDGCLLCVFFLLSSLPRLSSVSVVFDFSALLSDVAPVSPILLSVDVKRKKRVNCWRMSFVCLLSFCLHNSDRVVQVLCLILVLHSMTLFLFLWWYCLLMWKDMEKSVLLMDVFYVSFFL